MARGGIIVTRTASKSSEDRRENVIILWRLQKTKHQAERHSQGAREKSTAKMTGVPSRREVVTFSCGDPTAPQTKAINAGDATMSIVKPIAMGSAETSSEMEVRGNIRELARGSAAFRQAESSDDEMSASSLDTLLGRVSENSTREIENLIGELQRLHKKLQTDRNRVQRYIAEYAAMNQQVMQLTKIISESVKKLPDAPSISA
jgi:hypothetical protein